MQAGAIARFGGITAYGETFHDGEFNLVDLDGWMDSPDVRGEDVPRPGGHGRFTLPMFLQERVVTLSGFHVAASSYEQWHDAKRLRGLLLTAVTLTIETPSGTQWVKGRVVEARYSPLGFAPEGDWRVVVECDDPRVYGETREYAAGQTAIHYGNWPATPRLLIGAGSGGYTITGPNGRQVVVGTAPAGAHYIDFANGGLYTAAGVRQPGAITTYRPWQIPAGIPGVIATITGARSLAQRVTDTST